MTRPKITQAARLKLPASRVRRSSAKHQPGGQLIALTRRSSAVTKISTSIGQQLIGIVADERVESFKITKHELLDDREAARGKHLQPREA